MDPRLERTLLAVPWRLCLYAAAAILTACFFACAWFLTIDADEAWNLMSIANAVTPRNRPFPMISEPVVTSGGFYALIHAPLLLQGSAILGHRIISILFALLTSWLIFRALKSRLGSDYALLASVLFLAIPGLFLQAGLATAEIVATLLILVAALYWEQTARSIPKALVGGALLGLAMTTRLTIMPMLPVFVVWTIWSGTTWRRGILQGAVVTAAAAATALLLLQIYLTAFGGAVDAGFLAYLNGATGAGRTPQPYTILNYLDVGQPYLPGFGVAGLTAALLIRSCDSDDTQLLRLCGLLVTAGLVGWLAWVVKAPIAHIRYLWPQVPMLWLAAIILLLSNAARSTNLRMFPALSVATLILAGFQCAMTVRAVAAGDTLNLFYAATRQSPVEIPRHLFSGRANQQATAAYLQTIPADRPIYATIIPTTYPLTYLSGRRFAAIGTAPANVGGSYLLLTPSDRYVWTLSDASRDWIARNARPTFVAGNFVIYRIIDRPAPRPAFPIQRIGEQRLPGVVSAP